MASVGAVPVALLVVLYLVSLLPVSAGASSQAGGLVLSVRFLGPVEGGYGWRVEARVGGLSCRGVVGVNPGYMEARAVSRGLVVLPFYYVLSSVCNDSLGLAAALDGLSRAGVVRVEVSAPGGYVVRTGLDWRGFGPPGGPYRVPGRLLHRFYLYDGLVVASTGSYRVVDYPGLGMSLVLYRGFRGVGAGGLAWAVAAASREAGRVFGASPRSPVVGVVASPREFALLAPSTAYSLGGVFLVVDSLAGRNQGWYVHVAAHEAVHGWLNDGLVYGDFSFMEAVVEFLALRGLYDYNRSLYRLAAPYSGEGVDAGEPYAVWMRAHAALWALSVSLCGRDAYSDTLRAIFQRSINSSSPRVYSVVDVLRGVEERCGPRVAEAWGRLLPEAPRLNLTLLLRDPAGVARLAAATRSEATRQERGPGEARSVEAATTSTVTVTVTATPSMPVSPAPPSGGGGRACGAALVVALLLAALCLARRRGVAG